MSDDILIRAETVSKRFCRNLKQSLWYGLQDLGSELRGRRHQGGAGLMRSSADVALRPAEFWAVKDVSFEVKRGECMGLIGRNGAGKTTLLRMLIGLIKPDTGRIEMRGRVGALIALGAGFNPVLTGRENIYVNANLLGVTKSEIDEKIDGIVDFAEIGEFIDSPVQSYSSGMQVRLGFAVATTINPDILILDEVLAVGDVAFRAKCFQRIGEFAKSAAVIFVSHSPSQVSRICDDALLLKNGECDYRGPTSAALQRYLDMSATPTAAKSGTLLLDSRVSGFTVKLPAGDIHTRAPIAVVIDVDVSEDIAIGNAFMNILDQHETAVAHVDIKSYLQRLKGGKCTLAIDIPPLMLADGCYWLNIMITALDLRTTIIHSVFQQKFNVIGAGPPLYCAFLPRPSSVTISYDG